MCSRNHSYLKSKFLSPQDPDTRDAAVIVLAQDQNRGKGILAQFIQPLEHP